jgi:hypothetical protein
LLNVQSAACEPLRIDFGSTWAAHPKGHLYLGAGTGDFDTTDVVFASRRLGETRFQALTQVSGEHEDQPKTGFDIVRSSIFINSHVTRKYIPIGQFQNGPSAC